MDQQDIITKRPKPTDSEDDILEMQRRYLSEKNKNADFKPAAQVVSMRDTTKKPSLFAQRRSQQKKEDPVKTSNVILGDILERDSSAGFSIPKTTFIEDAPFPKAERVDRRLVREQPTKGKSLFALSMEKKNKSETTPKPMEVDEKVDLSGFSKESVISDSQEIHEENLQLLAKMKKEEIMAERAKLLQSVDPSLVQFLAEKRRQKMEQTASAPPKKQLNTIEESKTKEPIDQPPIVSELLNQKSSENWLNFDKVEKEKFEWMKDLPDQISKLKPGEKFEARFDWQGVLLPYTENRNVDDRELYLHGDEPFRPGYTLPEFFRLARSKVMQQRISAFKAIGGILNIYNQGFYDDILDLPISKIFFLLRFGLDENALSTLEVCSRGLSALFYNDTDETVLDFIYETPDGHMQPSLENEEIGDSVDEENLEEKLKNMSLTNKAFSADVQESDEFNRNNMNDFQLAETDLMECLLRTNIIQRISYILGTVKPEGLTVHHCLKILIRIARTNVDYSKKIIENEQLMETLFKYFLPSLSSVDTLGEGSFYNYPQFLVLKLFRILMSSHLSICIKLKSMGILDKIKEYLFSKEDIKGKLVKVQIESLRIVRVMMILTSDVQLYRSLLPAFRYFLEWHFQHVIYGEGGPMLIRQHAAALLNAISSSRITSEVKLNLEELFIMCSCKWVHEASKEEIKEFSQPILLGSTLNCIVEFNRLEWNPKLSDFITKYLRVFIKSEYFLKFMQPINLSSVLLKSAEDRRQICPSLPNIGSILNYKSMPQLILSQTYPIYFLKSLLKLVEFDKSNDILNYLLDPSISNILLEYLQKISKDLNRKIGTNFLAKQELGFLFKLLQFSGFFGAMSNEEILLVTLRILNCLTAEHVDQIEDLFSRIIFTEKMLSFPQSKLNGWKVLYLETLVAPYRVVISPLDLNLTLPSYSTPILPSDWPYLLLKSILNKYLKQNEAPKALEFPHSEVIKITFNFVQLLEKNNLFITSLTEKLMYLMISFMGPNSEFLEPDMKVLLKANIQEFFKQCSETKLNFEGQFEGKSKFENLYILFLDHFQAASYGDELFASLVMVPLAQKYDPKWRKIVWSEHASVLRFIGCKEDQLLGGLEAYLTPFEEDESLVKSYARALNSNLLRINSVPHQIALHHLNNYKNFVLPRKSQDDKNKVGVN